MNEFKTKVQAEIEYQKPNGEWIHSDIEPYDCLFENLDNDHKKFLHGCLDDWIDDSRGTGCFYIKNVDYNVENKNDFNTSFCLSKSYMTKNQIKKFAESLNKINGLDCINGYIYEGKYYFIGTVSQFNTTLIDIINELNLSEFVVYGEMY